jgi:hypothetical protein
VASARSFRAASTARYTGTSLGDAFERPTQAMMLSVSGIASVGGDGSSPFFGRLCRKIQNLVTVQSWGVHGCLDLSGALDVRVSGRPKDWMGGGTLSWFVYQG